MAAKVYIFLLLSLLTADLVRSNMNGCQCDSSTIACIYKYWEQNGYPESFIKYLKRELQLNISMTTPGYFSEDVACCHANYYSEDYVELTQIYKNGDSFTVSQYVMENSPGVLTRYDSNGAIIHTYIIYTENGGVLCYKCSDTATCTEPHAAFVVPYSRDASDPAPAERAIEVADSIGLNLKLSYECDSLCT